MATRFSTNYGLDRSAPALPLLMREAGSFAAMRAKASFASPVQTGVQGDGRAVIVLPGFLASDVATSRLRTSLTGAGFRAHGWGLGRNFGVKADMFERLDRHLDTLNLDQPVTLIGWSLGGLIAREYAKYAPDRVRKVITLGTPFSGDMRANNAWRLYEWVAGHKVDTPQLRPSRTKSHRLKLWRYGRGVMAWSPRIPRVASPGRRM